MPQKDGTGPAGQGPIGAGRGQGRGRNQGDKPGSGPGGNCICPNCGQKTPHQPGQPCNKKMCPKCGAQMTRE